MPRIRVDEWPPYSDRDKNKKEASLTAARLMMNGAMTAPFTGGVAQIEGEIVYGEDELDEVARKMEELAYTNDKGRWKEIFLYESVMVRESDVLLFIGNYRARRTPMDVGCGLCGGRPDCSFLYERRRTYDGQIDLTVPPGDKAVDGPLCSVRVNDLGYAVGSALWLAATLLIDAKPMMSAGVAGSKLGYCGKSGIVVAIAAAALSKNPYVDICPEYHLVNMERMIDAVRKVQVIPRQVGEDYRMGELERGED